MVRQSFDVVLIGGGLQSALLTLALRALRPAARIAVVEREPTLGGNHTWCFHAADVSGQALSFVEPLVEKRWPAYSVHFEGHQRRLTEAYACVTSSSLSRAIHAEAERAPGLTLLLGEIAHLIRDGEVMTTADRVLRAPLIVDSRGPEHFERTSVAGFQKFVGLELQLEGDGAPAEPILMDARVPQVDGLRFFYVLPLARNRVLVEDTYFADSAAISREKLRAEILGYAERSGFAVRRVLREESGVLPLPLRLRRPERFDAGLLLGGYRGGWFHPTTGYSFPVAVRFAEVVATSAPDELPAAIAKLSREIAAQQRYCTLLNRLLFDAFEPAQRVSVFERFYRLPEATVRRFYALDLTHTDRARLLCGRPPRGFSLTRLLARNSTSENQRAIGDEG